VPSGSTPDASPQVRTITVGGTGRVAVRPDLADLRIGVTVTEPSIEDARAGSARALTAVLERLKGLGIAERDLQTSIVAVSPAYDYSSNTNPPRLTGYTITNLVAVVVRDIDRVGDAIDAALAVGATTIDRIAFRVEDQSAAEAQAREAAMADAKGRAETLAAAAGVAIAGVAAIVEAGAATPYPTPFAEMAKMAASDASTPIEAGMNEVSATVTVTYLIE
jgi:hypothetical protein